ncbi:MAG: sorting protein [Rhizobacter sp.]|nr:sorting protein [Rhizobacter sp.]
MKAIKACQSAFGSLCLAVLASCGGGSTETTPGNANRYAVSTFVANDSAAYQPTLGVEPKMVDAWGIAIRPAGVPGHFWVVAGDKSYEYLGDVTGRMVAPCTTLSALCADLAPLPSNTVRFPDFPLDANGQPDIVDNHGTGVVFNPDAASFVITQTPTAASTNLAPITAGAKFLFTTNYGAIYAWTERKHADGTFDRADTAVKIFDSRSSSSDCGQFYGMTLSPTSNRLYVADFGTDTSAACNNASAIANVSRSFKVRVFDGALKPDGTLDEITSALSSGAAFPNPFNASPTTVKAGDYVPWNVQLIGTSVFVAYAKVQQDPAAAAGTPWPANEVHAPGAGRVAEFDLDGKLIKAWDDRGLLNAPWGLAMAPATFGALSRTLLVGNFGDYDDGGSQGAITAFDSSSRQAVNVMRDAAGAPLLVPGIWGMVFGNGDTLGDTDALYFASGPNAEIDGTFGSIRHAP